MAIIARHNITEKMMLKKIVIGMILLLTGSFARAQNVTVTPEAGGGNGYFLVNQAAGVEKPMKLVVRKTFVSIVNTHTTISAPEAWNLSPDHSVLAAITAAGIRTYEYPGKALASTRQRYQTAGDPSLAIYPLNDGKFIVRSNIAHFDFSGPGGKNISTASNATGSAKGETISEVITNPEGRSAWLINPKFYRGDKVASRIQRWDLVTGDINAIYYGDEALADVQVSEDGALLAAHTIRNGRSRIEILDGFGNKLNTLKFADKLDGYALSGRGTDQYVTVWKGNLVRTFSVLSGKRILYTSFQGPQVQDAVYEAADHNLVGIAFTRSGEDVEGPEVFVVNTQKRKIATERYKGSLRWLPGHMPLKIKRSGAGRYVITGLSIPLKVRAQF